MCRASLQRRRLSISIPSHVCVHVRNSPSQSLSMLTFRVCRNMTVVKTRFPCRKLVHNKNYLGCGNQGKAELAYVCKSGQFLRHPCRKSKRYSFILRNFPSFEMSTGMEFDSDSPKYSTVGAPQTNLTASISMSVASSRTSGSRNYDSAKLEVTNVSLLTPLKGKSKEYARVVCYLYKQTFPVLPPTCKCYLPLWPDQDVPISCSPQIH